MTKGNFQKLRNLVRKDKLNDLILEVQSGHFGEPFIILAAVLEEKLEEYEDKKANKKDTKENLSIELNDLRRQAAVLYRQILEEKFKEIHHLLNEARLSKGLTLLATIAPKENQDEINKTISSLNNLDLNYQKGMITPAFFSTQQTGIISVSRDHFNKVESWYQLDNVLPPRQKPIFLSRALILGGIALVAAIAVAIIFTQPPIPPAEKMGVEVQDKHWYVVPYSPNGQENQLSHYTYSQAKKKCDSLSHDSRLPTAQELIELADYYGGVKIKQPGRPKILGQPEQSFRALTEGTDSLPPLLLHMKGVREEDGIIEDAGFMGHYWSSTTVEATDGEYKYKILSVEGLGEKAIAIDELDASVQISCLCVIE